MMAYRPPNSHPLGNGSPIGLEKTEICMHIEFYQNTHFYARGHLKVVYVQSLWFLVSTFPFIAQLYATLEDLCSLQ